MRFSSNGTSTPYKSKMEGDMKNEGWLGNLPIKKKKKGKEKKIWCSWAREKIPMNGSNMRKRRKEKYHTRAYIPFTTKYSILIIHP